MEWAFGISFDPTVTPLAAHFVNASSQSLTIADNANVRLNGTDWSFACWVRPTDFTTYHKIIAKESGGSQATIEYEVRFSPAGRIEVVLSNGANFATAQSTFIASANTWYWIYVEFTVGTPTINIYINNVLDSTLITGGIIAQGNTGTFGFGWDGSNTGLWMNGDIDAAGLWKRILTSGERGTIYNSGAGVVMGSLGGAFLTNIVGTWDFNNSNNIGLDNTSNDNLTNNNTVTTVAGIT